MGKNKVKIYKAKKGIVEIEMKMRNVTISNLRNVANALNEEADNLENKELQKLIKSLVIDSAASTFDADKYRRFITIP